MMTSVPARRNERSDSMIAVSKSKSPDSAPLISMEYSPETWNDTDTSSSMSQNFFHKISKSSFPDANKQSNEYIPFIPVGYCCFTHNAKMNLFMLQIPDTQTEDGKDVSA
jgi:hypothetical protein